jgi:hypothetical protein
VVAAGLVLSQAAAAQAGSVAGRVVDADTNAPLVLVKVEIYDCAGRSVASATTDDTGAYATADSLAAGAYLARTRGAPDHIDALYRDADCAGDCDVMAGTPFAVGVGRATVDFALKKGGRILGRVTNAAGDPVVDVAVGVYDWFGSNVGTAVTRPDGTYVSSPGLPTGTYYVRTTFNSSRLVDEAYDDRECAYGRCDVVATTPVVVKRAVDTTGIDFSLAAGGAISGRVSDRETGVPVGGGLVVFYDSEGRYVGWEHIGADGHYESPAFGLPSGLYTVRVGSSPGHCPDPSTATAMVTAPATTHDVDLTVAAGGGGGLGGTVQDADTLDFLVGAPVSIYGEDGAVRTAWSNIGGSFSIDLCPGRYRLVAASPPGQSYVRELYDDIPCLACAVGTGTPVTVTADGARPVVNFFLERGGLISGIVSDAVTGLARNGLKVTVYDAGGNQVGTATTDCHGDGNYRAPADGGLPDGEYYVTAEGRPSHPYPHGYRREVFDDKDCRFLSCVTGRGTALPVVAPRITPGASFALVRRRRNSDYDRDGRSDLALHNGASGEWRVRAASGAVTIAVLTGHGLPAADDYDGDGKTDMATYDPTLSLWRVRRSSSGTEFTENLGGPGQLPAHADFDNDGGADPVAYDPATGVWTIRRYAGAAFPRTDLITWGGPGRVPVPADYDGDGKADVATYAPATGAWSIRRARNDAEIAYTFGGPGQIPVPGDFDGDGRTDIATFEPATGIWKILNSSTGRGSGFRLGGATTAAVTLDFDGDGRSDAAVYDPAARRWRVRLSATGTEGTIGFGAPGFAPQG